MVDELAKMRRSYLVRIFITSLPNLIDLGLNSNSSQEYYCVNERKSLYMLFEKVFKVIIPYMNRITLVIPSEEGIIVKKRMSIIHIQIHS